MVRKSEIVLAWLVQTGVIVPVHAPDGVPQDDTEAVQWYRLAAEQGYAKAQFNLGLMYAKGRGGPQDDTEAVRWYRLAAEQGTPTRSAPSGSCIVPVAAFRRT